MNRILEIDHTSLVVTAEAGIDGPALEEELNAVGLTMPHYPGSFHFGATLGGFLAARGSGVLSTKYGKAEDLVLQVQAALPPGRLVETLPTPNHASGPDLVQVLVAQLCRDRLLRQLDGRPADRHTCMHTWECRHKGSYLSLHMYIYIYIYVI